MASVIVGGLAAISTYQHRSVVAQQLKDKELRQVEYAQKREIYYELVDTAARASASLSKADAERNAADYWRMYFGKAHIAVVDPSVLAAKTKFARGLVEALKRGNFPTTDLEGDVLELAEACQQVLKAENLFPPPVDLSPSKTSSAS